jgi:hypothetical protein
MDSKIREDLTSCLHEIWSFKVWCVFIINYGAVDPFETAVPRNFSPPHPYSFNELTVGKDMFLITVLDFFHISEQADAF